MAVNKITGSCFCGAVELSVSGESVAMGYCHCKDCAKWSASPINSYSFWAPDQLEITKGKEHIQTFSKTSHSRRKFCKKCGGHHGHIFDDGPEPTGKRFCNNGVCLIFKPKT